MPDKPPFISARWRRVAYRVLRFLKQHVATW